MTTQQKKLNSGIYSQGSSTENKDEPSPGV